MFIMVAAGDVDQPIYEAEFINTQRRDDDSHLNQFIIHAALDMVDECVWGTQSMYLKCVHKFNGAGYRPNSIRLPWVWRARRH